MVPCILCQSNDCNSLGSIKSVDYYRCNTCYSIFKDTKFFPNSTSEKEHYLLHENDVNDKSYQHFVGPIFHNVLKHFKPRTIGLDFGAGTAPVLATMLSKRGYEMQVYDPFFHPNKSVLKKKYDFITCCEVVEHFHKPYVEFELLYNLLNPGGMLFCMTELQPEIQKFDDWYYKKDPTHVIFYSKRTLNWIKTNVGFSKLYIEGRLFVLTK